MPKTHSNMQLVSSFQDSMLSAEEEQFMRNYPSTFVLPRVRHFKNIESVSTSRMSQVCSMLFGCLIFALSFWNLYALKSENSFGLESSIVVVIKSRVYTTRPSDNLTVRSTIPGQLSGETARCTDGQDKSTMDELFDILHL